jgi:hypothetical protein
MCQLNFSKLEGFPPAHGKQINLIPTLSGNVLLCDGAVLGVVSVDLMVVLLVTDRDSNLLPTLIPSPSL